MVAEPPDQQRRCHVIGQVRDDPARRHAEAAGVRFERVGEDHGQAAGKRGLQFGQGWPAALVALDGDHLPGAHFQQRAREAAGPRADLDDGALGEIAGGARDAAGEVEIEQEMLAKRAAGAEAVARDDITERRQVRRRWGGRTFVHWRMST